METIFDEEIGQLGDDDDDDDDDAPLASGSGSRPVAKKRGKIRTKHHKPRKRKCKEEQDEGSIADRPMPRTPGDLLPPAQSRKKKRGEGKGIVADDDIDDISEIMAARAAKGGSSKGGKGKVAKGQGIIDEIIHEAGNAAGSSKGGKGIVDDDIDAISQAAKAAAKAGNSKGGKGFMDEIIHKAGLAKAKGKLRGPPPGTPGPKPYVDPYVADMVDYYANNAVAHNCQMWNLVQRRKHEANTPPQGTPDTRYDDYWETMMNETQDRNHGSHINAFYKGKHKGRLLGHY